MEELRILSPTAILGYGFPVDSFKKGIALKPHVIAVDAGSTDPGPHYLGDGTSFTTWEGVKRDMEHMLEASLELGIPVIIGTAGGSGANSHLDWNVDIAKEISREKGYKLKIAIIPSEIDKQTVLNSLEAGKIVPLSPAPELTKEDVLASSRIVAQMGHESMVAALEGGADLIITGRSYDPAVFAALAIQKGYDLALAMHLGKILECAAIAASPGSGSDCLLGYLGDDYFRLETLSDLRKCTTLSVAAHTLYEKSDPYHLPGPGGSLDLTETTFEQTTDSAVTVRGTKFVPTEKYYVKLEGAKRVGYRTVSIAAAKDPIFIEQVDSIIEEVKQKVKSNFEHKNIGNYHLDFKLYGKNGVMSMFENIKTKNEPNEIGIVIESVAETQDLADTIVSFARSSMLHFGYAGRKSTAGNLAFPFSPSDFVVGEVYEFSLYHLMEIDNPDTYFKFEIKTLDKGELI